VDLAQQHRHQALAGIVGRELLERGIASFTWAPWFARATFIASMKRRSPSEARFASSTAFLRCSSFPGGGVTADR
jgi:hypothetical protein